MPKGRHVEHGRSPDAALDDLLSETAAATPASAAEELRALLSRYDALLRAADRSHPRFQDIIDGRQRVRTLLRESEPPAPTPDHAAEGGPQLPEALFDEARIPRAEREAFEAALAALPTAFHERFLKRLPTAVGDADEVRRVTGLRGLTFEMTRITGTAARGLETVDPQPRAPKVSYAGYRNAETDFSRPPSREVRDGTLQLDVPIVRDGKPFAYEVKSYPRKAYGTDAQARNQALKYQAAVEQGVVDGATIELRGRLDLDYLVWAMGESMDDPGAIPDVQLVYNFELPSGKEYRFTLKRGAAGKGLRFRNEEKYEGEDLDVVIGIQEAIADKSIIGLISRPEIPEERASETLRPYLDRPETIHRLDVFQEYDALRRAAITEALRGKRVVINETNEKSAVSEYADRAYVERLVREFQEYLSQNPAVAEVKRHYVLPEDRIEEAVARTLAALERIAAFERERAASSAEAESRARRAAEGYAGKPEGVALDIEHVMLDTVYGMNKEGTDAATFTRELGAAAGAFTEPLPDRPEQARLIVRTEAELQQRLDADPALKRHWLGMSKKQQEALTRLVREAAIVRTYEWPERFSDIRSFMEGLDTEDRRYREIHVFDPRDGKTARQANTSEEDIMKTRIAVSRENIARAEAAMSGTPRAKVHAREIMRIKSDIRTLEAELAAELEPVKKAASAEAQRIGKEAGPLTRRRQELLKQHAPPEEIEALDREIDALAARRAAAFTAVRALSERYQALIGKRTRALEETYRRVFPHKEWEAFAKRITKEVDQNILKAIYVVDAEGNVIVQEEVLRGLVVGRAAHSELTLGRNAYAAGELAFTKGPGGWRLTEINNGSGHYRPDAEKTLTYAKARIATAGVDVSGAKLVDAILRGRALRDATAF